MYMTRETLPHVLFKAITVAFGFAMTSCSLFEPNVAELRTDVPQMALYAVAFNTSQNRYRINVSYDEDVAESLDSGKNKPALVIGRYLKNSSSRANFQSLDHLFSELVINQSLFYPSLLELGLADGRQILLPVSFNLPLVVFDKKYEPTMLDGFVLDLAELEKKGAALNKSGKTSYTNMGFGPRWSTEFLYSTIELFGAAFKEGTPLKWNQAALEDGLAYIRGWSERANGSAAKEDEFQFKYLYLPEYASVEEGRIGFAAMNSAEFFVVSEERRSSLSFRLLARDGAVPIDEDLVYAGISRKGSGKQAAEAFLTWFYAEETQRSILEEARRYRSMESSFGIAGGFSSVRAVNDKLFPLYYPSLLGKMPPAHYLKTPNVLPALWPEIKKSIVLPFLLEATGPNPLTEPNTVLESRLQAWMKRRSSN